MRPFELEHDAALGLITCRTIAFPGDDAALRMAADLHALMARTRHGHVLLLIDKRAGSVFSAAAVEAMDTTRQGHHPDDRVAVLAASSLHKMQAVRKMSGGTQVFISETAAMTWLLAWKGIAR